MTSDNTTLFVNGRIFQPKAGTSNKEATFHNCMLVRDGLIEHVGAETDAAIVAVAKQTKLVHDLGGRTVLPGFVDGHMHFLMLGQSLQKVGLEHCKSLEDIRAAITEYAEAHPDVPRIMCRSYMHSMTPGGVSAAMLDDLDAPRHRPIFIDAKDLHSTWCSTAALSEMGLLAGQANEGKTIDGGTIVRDDAGSPTGLLSEAVVFDFVWPHLATVATVEERAQSVRAAVEAYIAAGYTGVVEMALDEGALEAILFYLQSVNGQIPLRMAAYWLIKPRATEAERLAQVDRAVELSRQYDGHSIYGNKLRIIGIKLVCDGIIDACTAFLSEPYGGDKTLVDPIWAAEQLQPVVQHAAAGGLQLALHAIGDGTIAMAIDVIEAVWKKKNTERPEGGAVTFRPRIEHIELSSPASAARLGKLGITASVQPVHADPAILRAWPRLLGEHRCGRAFAYREFADGGAPLALGTDSPTAPHLPLANAYVATTRRSARESDLETTFNPHFALNLCEALTAYSEGAAYSCGAETWAGRLEAGKAADFVVVDMDWDASKLLSAQVKETWFEGQQVYESK